MQLGSLVRNMCFFHHLRKCKGRKKGRREGRKEGGGAEGRERGREEGRHLPESWILLTSHPVSLWGPEEFALRMTRSGLQIAMLDVKWNEAKRRKAPHRLAMPQSPFFIFLFFLDQPSLSALSFMGLIDQGRSSFCGSWYVMGLLSRAWNQPEQSTQVITYLQ